MEEEMAGMPRAIVYEADSEWPLVQTTPGGGRLWNKRSLQRVEQALLDAGFETHGEIDVLRNTALRLMEVTVGMDPLPPQPPMTWRAPADSSA